MIIPQKPLDTEHPDAALVDRVCLEIERASDGWDNFLSNIPARLRQAIDEVIDTPRSGRFVIEQLEKTEKTYIGTKVEILIRDFLKVPKGLLLDLEVDGVAVDVKNTVGDNWMIPREAHGHPCILVRENEKSSECSIGVIVARPEYLTKGENRDRKVSISAKGRENVHWLLHNYPYPKNFWNGVGEKERIAIMRPQAGTKRLARLMLASIGRPVPREVVAGVARQQDFSRRMRRSGGVRDVLGPMGIVVLNGTYDATIVRHFGHPDLDPEHFLALEVRSTEDIEYLNQLRHSYVTHTYGDKRAIEERKKTQIDDPNA